MLGCNGSGSTSGVIDGINWVKNNASGPSVANMSLGGGASSAIDQAVEAAVASGVSFVSLRVTITVTHVTIHQHVPQPQSRLGQQHQVIAVQASLTMVPV